MAWIAAVLVWLFGVGPVLFVVATGIGGGLTLALATQLRNIRLAHWFFSFAWIWAFGGAIEVIGEMKLPEKILIPLVFVCGGAIAVLCLLSFFWVERNHKEGAAAQAATVNPPPIAQTTLETTEKTGTGEQRNPTSSPGEVRPKEPPRAQAAPLLEPEISASFVQGTSPGLLVINRSKVTIKSPVAHFAMWNLSRIPALMIPTWDVQQAESFIKPNSGLIWATADTPQAKPYLNAGDEMFALITVDCPDCKAARSYYLHFVYGQPQSGWFSEIPERAPVNVLLVNSRMQEASWSVQTYLQQAEHGPILAAESPNGLIQSMRQQ